MYPVRMPKQGITVESCVITTWHKKQGDVVNVGDTLFSYETDKAAFDVEAEDAGQLIAIFFPEGEEVPVLTPVAAIGKEGEDVSEIDPRKGSAEIPTPEPVPAPSINVTDAPTASPATSADTAVRVSPRARAFAASLGIDAGSLTGSGPDGRVIERDVRARAARLSEMPEETPAPVQATVAAVEQKSSAQGDGYTDEKLSGVRRAIARSMMLSLSTSAQLTLSTSFDASAILALRKSFKASDDAQVAGITLTDMVLYATARALTLPQNRYLNAHLMEGDIFRVFDNVHLAVAVDTPRGLLVPVVRGAQNFTLKALSVEVKRLAEQARSGSIPPDLLSGGTFTVTNLGGLGIEHFTPVINPPQTGILGVNNITWRPRGEDGVCYPAMGLSITFDHRAVDGAPAARFVAGVGRMLEQINALLAG